MQEFVTVLWSINRWVYSAALIVLVIAAYGGWKRTGRSAFLLIAVALVLLMVQALAMRVYMFTALRGVAEAELDAVRTRVLHVRFLVTRCANLVEYVLLLIGGFGLLGKWKGNDA